MAGMKPERERADSVGAYKGVLKRVLDTRPSGTRHRLAIALGKNRSFISQIANPVYAVPIPVQHLETIFEICHFTAADRREFLAAYAEAHPRRLDLVRKPTGARKPSAKTKPPSPPTTEEDGETEKERADTGTES